MKVKGITDECFTDYKLPAMFIAVNSCSFKCDRENGCQLCQNMALAREPDIEVSKAQLFLPLFAHRKSNLKSVLGRYGFVLKGVIKAPFFLL